MNVLEITSHIECEDSLVVVRQDTCSKLYRVICLGCSDDFDGLPQKFFAKPPKTDVVSKLSEKSAGVGGLEIKPVKLFGSTIPI